MNGTEFIRGLRTLGNQRKTIPVVNATPRAATFGYECHRCLRCCHDKRVQVNPYEVARLARNRGVTVGEFRERYTENATGTVLGRKSGGACVFLGTDGCTVHEDRPLSCRLYPLDRHVNPDGDERYSYRIAHPQSEGVHLHQGTIDQFLESQGAKPFLRAADAYYFWMCRVFDELSESMGDPAGEVPAIDLDDGMLWLDMDYALHRYCAEEGLPEPEDIEDRATLHLTILNVLTDRIARRL